MKYAYSTLRVMCYNAKYFAVDQLREAVEYLKTQPQTKFTGLQATTSTTAGTYKLLAQPILPLDQILGKTPREVWAAFDVELDRWRRDLEAASTTSFPYGTHLGLQARKKHDRADSRSRALRTVVRRGL